MSYGKNRVGKDAYNIFFSAAWLGGEAPGVWNLSGPAAQPRAWGSSCCDCVQEVPTAPLFHKYFSVNYLASFFL